MNSHAHQERMEIALHLETLRLVVVLSVLQVMPAPKVQLTIPLMVLDASLVLPVPKELCTPDSTLVPLVHTVAHGDLQIQMIVKLVKLATTAPKVLTVCTTVPLDTIVKLTPSTPLKLHAQKAPTEL
jgi:hypothetical protein